jgi:hypothetical protein
VRWAALALAALALTGCETTAQKSAKLEKVAKQHERETAVQTALAHRAITITHVSSKVLVSATAVIRASEGAAAVITLRNLSSTALRDVPVQIDVKDTRGASVYRNNTPGLGVGLASAPLVPAHGTLTWIDDQVQGTGAPASVTTRIGEGTPASGPVPQLSVTGTHLSEGGPNGPGLEGEIVNRSPIGQQELVVYAVARKGTTIVAAGRAIVLSVPAAASTRFQLFFIGNPQGAKLEVSAPATTFA